MWYITINEKSEPGCQIRNAYTRQSGLVRGKKTEKKEKKENDRKIRKPTKRKGTAIREEASIDTRGR